MNKFSFRRATNSKLHFAAVLVLLSATVASASFEIDLTPGWNLISLPEQQEVVDIDEVTVSIGGEFSSIWTWGNGAWQVYDPSLPQLSTLTTMDAGRAYWIYMEQAGTLVGHGLRPASTIELAHGWNMIGFNDEEPADIGDLLDDTGPCISSIWAYEGGSWTYYQRNSPQFSNLQYLRPGQGYWVKSNGACQLSVNLSIPSTTKTVQPNELALLTEVSSNRVVFSSATTNLSSVQIGDTLACPPTTLAPTGFLRKVTDISVSGGLTLSTGQALLNEALETAVVGSSVQFGAADAKLVETPELKFASVSKSGEPFSEKDLHTKVAVQIHYRYELEDDEFVWFKGTLEFEPEFLLSVDIENWTLEGLTARFTGRADANISVVGSHELSGVHIRTRVGNPIRFTTVVLWAGWFPITITPQLQVWVGMDGSVSLTVSTSVGLAVEASAGVQFTKDNGWEWLQDFSKRFYWEEPSIAMSGSLTAWAGPHLEFMIYELAGPYLGIHGFGQFVVSTSNPPVQLFVGWEFEAGITTAKFLEMFHVSCDDCQIPLGAEIAYRAYPRENATLRGMVVDENGSPISGVKVLVESQEKSSAFTDHNGEYQLAVLSGNIPDIEYSKDGYQTSRRYDITATAGQVTNVPVVSLFRYGVGSFGGIISDALTGEPVGGLTVQARKGTDVTSGGIYGVATTESDGTYEIKFVDAGPYTVEASGTGYQTSFFSANCVANQTSHDQHGTVTPLIEGGDIRIVLTWGNDPRDLDSHLTGPISGSSSRFHVYYVSKGNLNASPFAYLDHDDTDSYGPETITITQEFNGVYRYSVHDFSNRYSSSSDALARSSANVDVYRGSNRWKRFYVPSPPGTLWTVFEYENGLIREINSMSYESNPGSVQKSGNTDVHLLHDLPAKEAQ